MNPRIEIVPVRNGNGRRLWYARVDGQPARNRGSCWTPINGEFAYLTKMGAKSVARHRLAELTWEDQST